MRPAGNLFNPAMFQSWVMILGVFTLVLAGILVAQRIRSFYFGPDDSSERVLDALREALEAGEISQEEFERARDSVGSKGLRFFLPVKPKPPIQDEL
jgi:uncharacterized membrane protein